MKLFHKSKDGGPESTVTGYWLIEWKRVFSVVLLKFENGSRDAYHTHAFDALSWVLRGALFESVWDDWRPRLAASYVPSLKPIFTPRECFHKVTSCGTTWVFSIRGPWAKEWTEYVSSTGETHTLTDGRKPKAD